MFLSVSELSPLSEKMEKPQQKRTEFSPVQIQRLEEEFEKKNYQTPSEMEALAHELQVDPEAVKNRFQNMRNKKKSEELVLQEENHADERIEKARQERKEAEEMSEEANRIKMAAQKIIEDAEEEKKRWGSREYHEGFEDGQKAEKLKMNVDEVYDASMEIIKKCREEGKTAEKESVLRRKEAWDKTREAEKQSDDRVREAEEAEAEAEERIKIAEKKIEDAKEAEKQAIEEERDWVAKKGEWDAKKGEWDAKCPSCPYTANCGACQTCALTILPCSALGCCAIL